MATSRQQVITTWARRVAIAVIAYFATVAAVRAAVWAARTEPVARRRHARAATDQDLADRVRTALGPMARELDVPHVHVMVERRVAILHGDVPDERTAETFVFAARAVPGVQDVVSKLHIGLLPSDTRPSAALGEPSHAHRALTAAAARSGGGELTADVAVAAVLHTLATEIGADATDRLRSHLPHDVASMLVAEPGIRLPSDDVATFYDRIVTTGAVPTAHVPWVTAAVLRTLRSLVPGDADAIATSLSPALAHLWDDAVGERQET